MLIKVPLDPFQKMRLLETAAEYDVCGAPSAVTPPPAPARGKLPPGVTRVYRPGGGCVSLLKVLMTNDCVNDCGYCVNQTGRDIRRTGFQPEELTAYFWRLHEAKQVTGLFLSSAISNNAAATMERMLKAVEVLRGRYRFTGYVHLKIMPGAAYEYVEQACRLADRVSINVEAPSASHLEKLSARKDLAHGILERMRWIARLAETKGLVPAGQTTQYVVGAAGETDREIYQSAQQLYREEGLRRAYFSAFQPVLGGRLEHQPPAPPLRAARLYELDWLQRVYRFQPSELQAAFDGDGWLPLERDPKLAIALRHLGDYPIDPNRADPWELLRVPGIGPVSVERILSRRKEGRIRSLDDLRRLGVPAKRAAPFVCLPEHRPAAVQLALL
ncbi:MAG: putative DNA modification/repair radical SAM protein [Bacteroidetes bacterium]|nr:putative DNA modification/repair radical SAM protein [Bacteroidota bacterium]MCL5025247.1 putative DNA modification/repair radical SAM protein [Chloroflexota bacterium]